LDTKYALNGEVDKRGHPILKALEDAEQNPDLLVHTTGSMAGNHAIIEVKPARNTPDGGRRDLNTLGRFRQRDIHYERAIYLFYGRPSCAERVANLAKAEFPKLPRIQVWEHLEPGRPAHFAIEIGDETHLP
jgi:hypothetical protein